LRHLFQANEMLGPMLVSIHNLTYYQRLLAEARCAIAEGQFASFVDERRRGWEQTPANECRIDD
jgi:queuine tRNA-ribosyltransferase